MDRSFYLSGTYNACVYHHLFKFVCFSWFGCVEKIKRLEWEKNPNGSQNVLFIVYFHSIEKWSNYFKCKDWRVHWIILVYLMLINLSSQQSWIISNNESFQATTLNFKQQSWISSNKVECFDCFTCLLWIKRASIQLFSKEIICYINRKVKLCAIGSKFIEMYQIKDIFCGRQISGIQKFDDLPFKCLKLNAEKITKMSQTTTKNVSISIFLHIVLLNIFDCCFIFIIFIASAAVSNLMLHLK